MRALRSFTIPSILAVIPILAGCDSTAPDEIPVTLTLVAADENGDIYTVNEETGVATFLLDTSTDDGAGGSVDVGVVSSMSYIPPTDEWWLGTGGQAECPGCIQTLDPSTGVATTLYDYDPGNRVGVSGLAVHPTTDRIFSFESDSSNELFELDAVTGVFTIIVDTLSVGSSGKGTTFSAAGDLYVVGDGDLYTVDPDTGAHSLIEVVDRTGFPTLQDCCPDVMALATRTSDGAVFGILRDGSRRDNYGTYLFILNLETVEAVLVGQTTDLLEGLAYIPTSMITP